MGGHQVPADLDAIKQEIIQFAGHGPCKRRARCSDRGLERSGPRATPRGGESAGKPQAADLPCAWRSGTASRARGPNLHGDRIGPEELDVAVDAGAQSDYADARMTLQPARVAVVFDGGDDWNILLPWPLCSIALRGQDSDVGRALVVRAAGVPIGGSGPCAPMARPVREQGD